MGRGPHSEDSRQTATQHTDSGAQALAPACPGPYDRPAFPAAPRPAAPGRSGLSCPGSNTAAPCSCSSGMWIFFGGFARAKKQTSVDTHEDADLEVPHVCVFAPGRVWRHAGGGEGGEGAM